MAIVDVVVTVMAVAIVTVVFGFSILLSARLRPVLGPVRPVPGRASSPPGKS